MEGQPKRKPRIRKSAPTVRERAEAKKIESQKTKPRRARKILGKAGAPVRKTASKVKLPDNRVVRGIKRALRWMVPKYFVNSWRELKLVTWPSRVETWRLTLAVFIFALAFGLVVGGVDKVLDVLFKKLILK